MKANLILKELKFIQNIYLKSSSFSRFKDKNLDQILF